MHKDQVMRAELKGREILRHLIIVIYQSCDCYCNKKLNKKFKSSSTVC